jgi:hypothetical protein
MNKTNKFRILFIIAIVLGMMIGFIDSRPHWDDAGITAGMILIVTACLGFVMPKCAWVWAISVGIWIPIWKIFPIQDYSSIIAIPIAFDGAYIGVLIYKLFFSSSD